LGRKTEAPKGNPSALHLCRFVFEGCYRRSEDEIQPATAVLRLQSFAIEPFLVLMPRTSR
jgi:hypothetical protein